MVNYQFLQNQKPNYQRRRLKWVVYDEYDELASAERIIIEPQTGLNQDLVGSNGSNSPNVPQDGIAKSSSIDKDSDINAQDEESSKSVSRKKSRIFRISTNFRLNKIWFQLYIDHPWASDDQDFTAESKRFLDLIKPFNDATHCSEKIEFEKVCVT